MTESEKIMANISMSERVTFAYDAVIIVLSLEVPGSASKRSSFKSRGSLANYTIEDIKSVGFSD
jgi:hypothetical protein